MKKEFILSDIIILFVAILFTGCNKNESFQSLQPSPRDGVYEGKNLTVTINGEPATSIKSVRIFSEKIGYANGIVIGDDKTGSNPAFHTSVIFNGFPGSDKELSLMTISTLYYFDGNFNLRTGNSVQYYEFSGRFVGNPDATHSEQGLILEVISVENPDY